MSLNDISDNAGAVQCIEGSHRLPIKPAIDFWYPYFTDKVANQNTDRHYFYCSAGDAFIFDSKLWHGSDENHVGTDRFAYVTRWVIEGKGFPEIPAIKPAPFGMFNCGNLTQEIGVIYYNNSHAAFYIENGTPLLQLFSIRKIGNPYENPILFDLYKKK